MRHLQQFLVTAFIVLACCVLSPTASGQGTGLTADYYDNNDFTTLKFTRIDALVDFDWGAGSPSNTVVADTFSVRWYGQVEPRYSETYTFRVLADDGARLWVNERLIAVRTVLSTNVPELVGTLALRAGERVNLRLEYIENTGNARVKLSWSSPSQPLEVIPQSRLYPAFVDPERGALLAERWNGLTGTNIATLTNAANFPNRPDGREMLTTFEVLQRGWATNSGLRVTGFIVPPTNGAYVFAVAADDTAQLFLSTNSSASNKTLIATVPAATAFRQFNLYAGQTSAPVTLTAGQKCYVELLQKQDAAGSDHFSVAWQPPGAAGFTVIPAENLIPAGLDRVAPAQSNYLDTLTATHPRLFATGERFELLRRTIASNSIPQVTTWWTTLSNSANTIIGQPVEIYAPDVRGTILATSRNVMDRMYKLGLAYRMTGNTNYAERAWLELQQVASTNFPDWHPAHFLDTAEMTHACAIGYDWLYDYWTPSRLDTIRTAIQTKGLKPSLTLYTNNSSWVASGANNWNLVCNGGMILGALALGLDGESTNEFVLSKAVASAALVMRHYTADNGGWYEGPGYWDYTTDYNIRLMAGLESALGSDFALSDVRAIWETGNFAMGMVGPFNSSFNFADAGAGSMRGSQMFWLARRYLRPEYAAQERAVTTSGEALDLLWYDTRGSNALASQLPPDNYYRGPTGTTPYYGADVLTLRTRWQDSDASFVGMHAGDVGADHGHLDAGGFVLDALGVRWAHDLGGDDYALPGYFSEPQRWTYYRLRAEGHNTLVINPGTNADQTVNARPPITHFASAPDGDNSFAITDLTSAYTISKVWRGVQLLNQRKWFLVQDELQAAAPANVWWFMHVNTATTVAIQPDGRGVMLTQGSDRLWITNLSGVGTFTLSNAVPLPTSPNPAGQNTNGSFRKLALNLPNTTNLTLAVLMVPLTPGQQPPTNNLPAIIPLNDWSLAASVTNTLPTNVPPATIATNVSTPAGVPVDIDLRLLASDNLTPSNSLIFSVFGGTNGTVTLLPDGRTARFTPATNFGGLASFKYVVADAWPDARMKAYYDFEQPESLADGYLDDGSGNANFGVLTTVGSGTNLLVADAPAALAGRSAQALQVVESGDFNGGRIATYLSQTELDYNLHDWTLAGWFKRATSTNDDFIFYLGSSDGFGTPDEFHLYGASGGNNLILRHYYGANSTDLDITVPNITTGVWRHAAVTFRATNANSGVVQFYLDGALVGTDSSVTFNLPTGSAAYFGGHAVTNFAVTRWFNGRLDDVAVFDSVLTAGDIAALVVRPAAYLGGTPVTNTVWINVIPGNLPPVFAAASNRLHMAGATMAATNSASDPDAPPQRLLYSLLSAPGGAAINPTNGVISWRPAMASIGQSNLFTVVVTEGGWLTNLLPVADAFVRDGSFSNVNYGTDTTLVVKASGSAGFRRESYLRFDLTGLAGGVMDATLQLSTLSENQPGVHAAAFVTNDTWLENSITWSNKPDSAAPVATWTPLAGTTSAASVTAPAQATMLGDRLLSLRVYATNVTADGTVTYGSRESGGPAPVLTLITTNGSLLSATQSFWVTVTAPASPTLNVMALSGPQFQLTLDGSAGPDYAVEASTNLTGWAEIYITNSPALPVQWTDPDTNRYPQRFYRVRLGP